MSSISSSNKPRLSFWQIWNMSFGFLGIQFAFALQNANTSRIFELLGANPDRLALFWSAAPITGLIVQPIIGYYSDRTWHPKWGRRRPYFAIGAILASAALILMPNSPVLWLAVGVLWIMDASINISMEPFRAFVGDMLPPAQRTTGFAMQSFFIGIGAIVASFLPWVFTNWFDISNESTDGYVPNAVKYAFYIGSAVMFLAVMWTVFSTKEYPPDASGEANLRSREKRTIENADNYSRRFVRVGLILLALAIIFLIVIYTQQLEKELYILVFGFGLFGVVHLLSANYIRQKRSYLGLVHMVKDFNSMPKTMVQLAYVQFFSWFALFSMWIYTTSATTSHIYDMKLEQSQLQYLTTFVETLQVADPDELKFKPEEIRADLSAASNRVENGRVVINVKIAQFFLDKQIASGLARPVKERLDFIQKQYNDGADWVGILFGIYNGIAALVAFMLPVVAKYTSRRITHLIALSCGGVGLISFYFISDPNLLLISMVGVGIAWASILSIPYAMLSGALPSEKMGYYMGVFNFFIVIPQIIASTVLGFMLRYFFDNHSIYILVAGGISMIVSGLLSLRVDDKDEVLIKANP